MLITILLWFYYALIAYGWGRLVAYALNKTFGGELPSIPAVMLLGIGALAGWSTFLSLFMRLNWEAHLITVLIALSTIFWLHKNKEPIVKQIGKPGNLVVLLFIAGAVSTLLAAVTVPSNFDTGLYHAQVIRWAETYRVIPGLANLHDRFAFNSSWFTLNALLSMVFLGGRSYHIIPSFLFLVFISQALIGLGEIRTGKLRIATVFRASLIPFAFNLFGSEISSPGNDLPSVIFIWSAVAFYLESAEVEKDQSNLLKAAAVFCGLAAVTLKLSAATILLLALIWGIELLKHKQWKGIVLMASLGCAMLVPWLARTVILSGYLAFPQTSLDIFQPDWKVPAEIAQRAQDYIVGWSRIRYSDPAVTLKLTFQEWFPQWYASQTRFRKIYFLVLVGFSIGMPALMFLPGAYCNTIKMQIRKHWNTLLTLFVGVAFWFMQAPNFRYGSGPIFGFIVLCTIFLAWPILIKFKPKHVYAAFSSLLFIIIVMIGSISFKPRRLTGNFIFPADYPLLPTYPCSLGEKLVLCGQEYQQCWYKPFPCLSFSHPNVEMRGDSYLDGFRTVE